MSRLPEQIGDEQDLVSPERGDKLVEHTGFIDLSNTWQCVTGLLYGKLKIAYS